MAEDEKPPGRIVVFRNPNGKPVPVPQDVAEASNRALRAHQLHLSGASWTKVAAVEGYPDARAAAADVSGFLREARMLITNHDKEVMLTTAIARYEELIESFWPAAKAGHAPSAKMVMDLVDREVSTLGLARVSDSESSGRYDTVVIPTDDYLNALKARTGAE